MSSDVRVRAAYVGCALATIAVGLAVHLGGGVLRFAVRDVLGDALWAMMVMWWISALGPRLRRTTRGGVALAVCYAVEISQLIQTPGLDAIRRTRLGHLVLGSGFDARDLVAYAMGALGAAIIDGAAALNRRPR